MKGVIVAGGMGTRLRPLTLITNKHLLPVYNKPMIMYPLETLKKAGITEIMIVCGKEHSEAFINFLGSGEQHGVRLSYTVQDKDNGGIADALRYAEDFSDDENIAVILGDNIFEDDFSESIGKFTEGAMIFLKEVENPRRFGVAVFDAEQKKIIAIEEKPQEPKSSYAQTGLYLFDRTVFSIISTLKPSARGEMEISDVVNAYIPEGKLSHSFVAGFWSDAGTFESLMDSALWAQKKAQ